MKAKDLDELNKLIEKDTDTFASFFLEDDSVAMYCYKNYSYGDLQKLMIKDPDPRILGKLQITTDEWEQGVEMALAAVKAENRF